MKNNWEFTYQNAVLVVICAAMAVWLLGSNYELEKSEIKIEGLENERNKLDSTIKCSQYRIDSLSKRDSILSVAMIEIANYKLINENITNDSLRALVRSRIRPR